MNALPWLYQEAVLFAAIGYLVIGADEIVIDLIWLTLAVRRLLRRSGKNGFRVTGRPQDGGGSKSFAVCIPARNESDVIGGMLGHALQAYAGCNVHIFVGCYSSDPETVEVVRHFAGPRLSVVIFEKDGQSTKAECLNEIYRNLVRHEARAGQRFTGIILHDAEDMVDGNEIAVFDAYATGHALIQLPVVPVPARQSRWISGHYCDEFAEAHTKTLIVRQALGAAIPSAGVGCMIRRDALDALAQSGRGKPFAEDSMTEDYEVGLRIAALGFGTAFLRIREQESGRLIATRACFPATPRKAVRQKARWVSGIALAGWDRLGWGLGLAENWMRLRDRMSLLSALVGAIGYLCLIAGIPVIAWGLFQGRTYIIFDALLISLVEINGLMLIWRLAMRFWFTARDHGWREGLFALPRMLVSSLIGIFVAGRAVPAYVRQMRTGILVWDKTDHEFPDLASPA